MNGHLFNPAADKMLYAAFCHAYSKPSETWEHGGRSHLPAVRDAFIEDSIARYMTGAAEPAQPIQAFTGVGDLPATANMPNINVASDFPYFDTGWRFAFRPIMLDDGQDSWTISHVKGPVTWVKLGEGGQVRTQDLSADEETFRVEDYGTELAFSRAVMQERRLYQFIQAVEQARAGYMKMLADAAYQALATAAPLNGGTIAQGTGATTLEKDINTINAGTSKIAVDLKDKFMGLMQARYILFVPESRENRALRAVGATADQMLLGRQASGDVVTVNRSITVIPTLAEAIAGATNASTNGILVLPGNDIQFATRTGADLRQYMERAAKSENVIRTFFTTWGLAIGDSQQVVQLALT